ncbi:hypothetical protein N7493_011002 [Penicillium malachiteum]|uniref:Uncharacterized protein n=1 Tax=Penicillium malachiteum TaxID=1324776 RepID=A0AAD6MQP4_9EURO|nr:hypothetical protein N7493_011002 [Penicillium malachiteum]
MCSFDNLAFLTAGEAHTDQSWSHKIIQGLSLFSRSLYFEDFSAYEYFQNFLGLVTGVCGIPEGQVSNEGFVDEETRRLIGWPTLSPFERNPLPFLRTLLNLRSKGHGFSQTHVGMVLDVRALTADHF